jgi:hypothetical protein
MLIAPLRYQSSHTGKHPVSLRPNYYPRICLEIFLIQVGGVLLSKRQNDQQRAMHVKVPLRHTGSPPLPFEHLKLWIMSLMTHVGPPTL